MKNSKSQAPTFIEISITKHQTGFAARRVTTTRPWSLKLGASLALGGWCLVLLIVPSTHAQSYSIDWFTIDGGGGTSTGGVYSVSGTIGQPDAGGPMTGGNYSVTGGFWSLFSVVQTPGAPLLSVMRTTTNTVLVSWASPSTGFNLEVNTNSVASVNCSNAPGTIQDNGAIKYVIVNPPTGNRFYRLFKP